VTQDRNRLTDILEAIDRIERYTFRGRDIFERDELIQVQVIHHIQIIGEAARGLSESSRARHPQIPWRAIIGMRNVLVHAYFGVELGEVWMVVERDSPVLRQAVQALLTELSGSATSEPG
jgi:uncharacterized protein with HEPN domain